MRINRIKFASELMRRDMTQKRIAELSGVSRSTINFIIGGKSCSETVAKKIANALGIELTDLIEK